ncbi:MAG TPA: hypothetical protein VN132_04940, partial [Bdellovibrio sp.]|nr:hypothetical protein [Bdellovibrio sp.]
MSSINAHYTFQYSQPEEYRFSHDSVFLARRVFELLKPEAIQNFRGLDLCSGCGIIGLDFLFHCQKEWKLAPKQFDFLEIQNVYEEHFKKNLMYLSQISTEIQFVNRSYDILLEPKNSGIYDLILCNPPYFLPHQGTLSPSEFKNRCRFFIDSDFSNLLLGIVNSLKLNGAAYVLLRDLSDQGWNSMAEAVGVLEGRGTITQLGDIRGTSLVRI